MYALQLGIILTDHVINWNNVNCHHSVPLRGTKGRPTLTNNVVHSVTKANHGRCCRFHKPAISQLRDLQRMLVACCIICQANEPDILLLTHARSVLCDLPTQRTPAGALPLQSAPHRFERQAARWRSRPLHSTEESANESFSPP